MNFTELAQRVNSSGWYVVNCFQIGTTFQTWRVNLQMRRSNGASTDYFSEFADANTPEEALEAAWANARARIPHIEKSVPGPKRVTNGMLTAAQEKRLIAAFDKWFFAIRINDGARR